MNFLSFVNNIYEQYLYFSLFMSECLNTFYSYFFHFVGSVMSLYL